MSGRSGNGVRPPAGHTSSSSTGYTCLTSMLKIAGCCCEFFVVFVEGHMPVAAGAGHVIGAVGVDEEPQSATGARDRFAVNTGPGFRGIGELLVPLPDFEAEVGGERGFEDAGQV